MSNRNRERKNSYINITTKSGFTCKVDPEKLDDWEFMKAIVKTENGTDAEKLSSMMYIANYLLGDNGEKRLADHLRNEKGVTPTSAMTNEIIEIFLLIKANTKKSQPSQ